MSHKQKLIQFQIEKYSMNRIWWNLKWKIPINSLEFRSVEVPSYSVHTVIRTSPAREFTRLCGTMIQSNNWPFNINHKNFISRITNTYKIFKRIGTRCTALYRESACGIFENVQNWFWNNLRYIETICATSKLVECHLRRPWRY